MARPRATHGLHTGHTREIIDQIVPGAAEQGYAADSPKNSPSAAMPPRNACAPLVSIV
ncbi:hypothetical protein P5W99_07695 [Paraburkholderia sp. A3BS-1L]|uniref:hypothetical protein n=1 Tax=Paraburkholderia sp. A3BS-1L TaxID=3028375 RepID=UPI003DA98549